MEAKRIKGFAELEPDKICYYQTPNTKGWMFYHPKCGLGDLSEHDVTEHEDGTITVHPSILVTGKDSVHGYLEKGIWRDC